jgi:hypothetical protein
MQPIYWWVMKILLLIGVVGLAVAGLNFGLFWYWRRLKAKLEHQLLFEQNRGKLQHHQWQTGTLIK